MSVNIETCSIDNFSVLINTSDVYRYGGSLTCLLSAPNNLIFELHFQIKNPFLSESFDKAGHLCYDFAEIRSRMVDGARRRLKWDEAARLVNAVEASKETDKHFRKMQRIAREYSG